MYKWVYNLCISVVMWQLKKKTIYSAKRNWTLKKYIGYFKLLSERNYLLLKVISYNEKNDVNLIMISNLLC